MTVQTSHRTGPIGRLARLGLAGVFALTFLSLVDRRGSARFRNPHILREPSAWLLHVLMFVLFLLLVGALASALAGPAARRRWQARASVVVAATATVAATIGTVTQGAAWGFPLADLVWWFDVLVVVEQFVALLVAIALGTPGCEIGVWSELLARASGEAATAEDGLACLVGLHLLDAWELRRRGDRVLAVPQAREPRPVPGSPRAPKVPRVPERATERIRAVYERFAPSYDGWMRHFDRWLLEDGRQRLCAQATGDTLEVAIGTGLNLVHYPSHVRLTGIDLSSAMLALAAARARELHREVDLRVGDAQALAFPDARFDTVVFTLSLCTIPDERRALAEAHRVLRPGGQLLLLEHVRSPVGPVRWAERLLDPLIGLSGDHLLRDPLDHLEASGFRVERCDRSKWGIVEKVVARKP